MTSTACLGLFLIIVLLGGLLYVLRYGQLRDYDPSTHDPDDPFPKPPDEHE